MPGSDSVTALAVERDLELWERDRLAPANDLTGSQAWAAGELTIAVRRIWLHDATNYRELLWALRDDGGPVATRVAAQLLGEFYEWATECMLCPVCLEDTLEDVPVMERGLPDPTWGGVTACSNCGWREEE